ncbi:hypothetical protein JOM56_001809 [Amanita muscaria]
MLWRWTVIPAFSPHRHTLEAEHVSPGGELGLTKSHCGWLLVQDRSPRYHGRDFCPAMLRHSSTCSQIEFCSLHVQGTDAVSTVPNIVLPQIHSLRIYTGGITVKLLIDALTAPNLKCLSFFRRTQAIDVDSAAFCQMIDRCRGLKHLTSFRVGTTSEPLDPLPLLEKLPHLETMEIYNGILDKGAINRISVGKVGSKLKKMMFKSRHDANEILRMVEVRQQNANLNNYGPLPRVSPFTEIVFNCVSVSTSVKKR